MNSSAPITRPLTASQIEALSWLSLVKAYAPHNASACHNQDKRSLRGLESRGLVYSNNKGSVTRYYLSPAHPTTTGGRKLPTTKKEI